MLTLSNPPASPARPTPRFAASSPAGPRHSRSPGPRLEVATEAVAALHPADAFDAELAIRLATGLDSVVAGVNAHAKECLRLASDHRNDLAASLKCRAQAATMMRYMQTGPCTLQRMQAALGQPRQTAAA
jgi:hypothetical protein